MDKFVYLAVLVAAGFVLAMSATVEAAPPIKLLAPKVVKMASKAGDDIANWLWKNKGAVTTAALIGTFALQPEPFLQAATTVASDTTEKVATSIAGNGGYGFLAVLIAIVGLIFLYEQGGRLRFFAKWGFAALVLITVFVLLGGVARADEIGVVPVVAGVGAFPWRFLLDVVILLIMLLPLT